MAFPGIRSRYDFDSGTIASIATTAGVTGTLTFQGTAPSFIVTSGVNYVPLIINPAAYSVPASTPEVVWIYSYAGAGTALILRAQEGTSAVGWPTGTVWSHGPTGQDFGIVNWENNGDFPTPTASGQAYVASSGGTQIGSWGSPLVPAVNVTSGALPPGVTIPYSQVTSKPIPMTISGVAGPGNSTLGVPGPSPWYVSIVLNEGLGAIMSVNNNYFVNISMQYTRAIANNQRTYLGIYYASSSGGALTLAASGAVYDTGNAGSNSMSLSCIVPATAGTPIYILGYPSSDYNANEVSGPPFQEAINWNMSVIGIN